VLCSLLWVTLLGQGVGLGDPQRSLPTPTMLGLCGTQSTMFQFALQPAPGCKSIPRPCQPCWDWA